MGTSFALSAFPLRCPAVHPAHPVYPVL